jgi:hypothetical protein
MASVKELPRRQATFAFPSTPVVAQPFSALSEPGIVAGVTRVRVNRWDGNRESKLMTEEVMVLKIFNNEIDAAIAQQIIQEAGLRAFVFKDDVAGMEPQLQRTLGVRLLVNRADAESAHQILGVRSL